MSSVLMTEPTIVKGGKAKEQQHKDDICAQVLKRLMMRFHRVVLLDGWKLCVPELFFVRTGIFSTKLLDF